MFNASHLFALAIGIAIGAIIRGKKPQKPWAELTEKEKKIRITTIITLLLLFIAGIIVAFLY